MASAPDVAAEAARWRDAARARRAEQDMPGAEAAIARAAALAPEDALTAFLHAQARFERGYPAAALFARAARLWPGNRDVVRNHALALAAEGEMPAADALLAAALAEAPDWLDGQRVLAALRFTAGDAAGYARGYATALRALPGHPGLWLGWFGAVAQQRDWPAACAILDAAEARLGATAQLASARAFVASETGELAEAERLLAGPLADAEDGFVALCRIRTALRRRDPARARDIALPLTATPLAAQVWPYLSTCWRLLGDPRAAWLDGGPPLVGEGDAGFTPAELAELAELLRTLHTARAPYAEQSVRGGTQTDRSLLLRHEPALTRARARLMAATREFVAALPPVDPAHPVLGRTRTDLRIAGSWSVRLGRGGCNVAHTHPAGWLSSAFYVALPPPGEMGAAPAGWLQLGAPPADLGLDLAPYRRVEPRVGRLVIFPALLWHGTEPTCGGERLNIAFDVVPASG